MKGFNIFQFLQLFGSVGILIFGMKSISDALQKLTGEKLRSLLRNVGYSSWKAISHGFFTTTLIQSSVATSILVVSFVNAGLLTLLQSLGLLLGVNIGKTVIGLLIWAGVSFSLDTPAIMVIGIFFPMLFSKKDNIRTAAEFVFGLGILFISLHYLIDAIPTTAEVPLFAGVILPLTSYGFLSWLIYLLLGLGLTALVQSSIAVFALSLALVNKGWMPAEVAAAMIIGVNIGTTLSANIAARNGGVNGKRAARFHLFFSIAGAVWMLPLVKVFLTGVDQLLLFSGFSDYSIFDARTILEPGRAEFTLTLFHFFLNLITVFLLVGFLPIIEKKLYQFFPSNGEEDEFKLRYLHTGVVNTPELSLSEARRELQMFAKEIEKMSFGISTLLFSETKDASSIIEKIKNREDLTDEMEIELGNFLTKVSESDLSSSASEKIRSMLSAANDLERMGDLYYQMARNYQRMNKQNILFPEDALYELKELLDLVFQAIKLMRKNLEKDIDQEALEESYNIERTINKKRKSLLKNHYERLERNVYTARAGVIYLDYVNRAEKIGDHIINVTEALGGIR